MPNEYEQPDDNILEITWEDIEWEPFQDKPADEETTTPLAELLLGGLPEDDTEAIALLKKRLEVTDKMDAAINQFEEEHGELKRPSLQVGEMEAARIFANWGYYDPPIYEEEIKADAKRYGISEREAEAELRRSRSGP
jgi:hypothetical protein